MPTMIHATLSTVDPETAAAVAKLLPIVQAIHANQTSLREALLEMRGQIPQEVELVFSALYAATHEPLCGVLQHLEFAFREGAPIAGAAVH